MTMAGLSVPGGASGPSLGFEDYSFYSNLSDEQLIQIAIERSLFGEDHTTTPSTDTRQTPPNQESGHRDTQHLPSTSTQTATPCVPNTSAQPSTQCLPSTSAQPGTQHLPSTSARPGTQCLTSTSARPGTQCLTSTSARPGNQCLPRTSVEPGTQRLPSTSAEPRPLKEYIHNAHYSSPNPPRPLRAERVEDPLLEAIKAGDADRVRELVSVPGCNMASSQPGWLAIHQAAYFGQEACLRVLLEAQPGMLNERASKEWTALMLAVSDGHESCVRLLLESGADPEIVNEDKDTPLYRACEKNNADLVAILLSWGAAVNTPCIHAHTALHAAVLQNNVEMCEMLVKAGAKIGATSTFGMTPLSCAALSGCFDTLRFLIKHGADIDGAAADGATPLYEACKYGHMATVEVLLSLKADVHRSTKAGLMPIHVAVQNSYSSIVSLLIPVTCQKKINMKSGISPLHFAAEHNRNDIMELLLKEGFDPDCQLSMKRRNMYEDKRSTALYFSVYNSNLVAVEMLLEAGANPNLDLFNPLLVAVRRGAMEMASLLLKYGADVNAYMSTQPSAFSSAVLLSMDYLPMLKLLLDHGCSARSCFTCVYGSKPHPTQTQSEERRSWNRDAPWNSLQFCEAVSKPSIRHLVGPLISLLLNYVGHVRLCSRLMEHLVSSPLCTEIKIKAAPPHPLMQLCRLRIRQLVGVGRLKFLRDLDLPPSLIKFLCYEDQCCSLDLDT